MSNVEHLNHWRENHKRIKREEDYKGDHTPLEYLHIHEDEIVGTLHYLEHLELASVDDLRKDILEQKEALETGIDKEGNPICDDKLEPRDIAELLVCKEGIFTWCWDCEDYVHVGELYHLHWQRVKKIKEGNVVR